MKRKIVVLGNGHEWCEKSLSDIIKMDNAKVLNYIFPSRNKIVRAVLQMHFSDKLNKAIKLPFQKVWFSYFLNNICEDRNSPLLLIIYDRNKLANNIDFLLYIRKKFKDIKLIYLFTNIAKISGASRYNFLDKLDEYYDVVYAFDYGDSLKYGFKYNPLLYSENCIENVEQQDKVFYVGAAKDRYDMLLAVFKRLNALGIESEMYIFGVDEEKQLYKDKIVYNQYISYSECLRHIQESRCLLDVIQGDSEGYTIKVCEAVMYDKLLISTNQNLKTAPFYNPEYMLVINEPEDIVSDFFKLQKNVKYNREAKEYFSVKRFLQKVEEDIAAKNSMKQ